MLNRNKKRCLNGAICYRRFEFSARKIRLLDLGFGRRDFILPLHQSHAESEWWRQQAKRRHWAKDKSRARQLPGGSFHCRHRVAGTAACCARRLECRGASRETAPLPATRRFAKAETRAIAPRDSVRRYKPQRRIQCGRTYRVDP